MTYTAAQQRERYYANLEENRRKHREYARANSEKYNAARRQRRAEDGDKIREYERTHKKKRDAASRSRDAHGRSIDEDRAVMWQAQGGRCYLCGEEMNPDKEKIDIDHDHSCCRRGKSCRICRRGLTHHHCNVVIGWVYENPAMLRYMADALEAAQREFKQRRDAQGQEQFALLYGLLFRDDSYLYDRISRPIVICLESDTLGNYVRAINIYARCLEPH
jgi:hypothetical protein